MNFRNLIPYKNNFFFGRANTAIWMLAKYIKTKYIKPTIILPSSMCVSPANIFFYEKIKTIFVDVNKETGIIDLKKVIKITKNKKNCFLFYVNLFGNFCNEKKLIKKIRENNVFIIQDIAQTFFLPNKKENFKQFFGDVCITSFGYSKIFDHSHGSYIFFDSEELISFSKKFLKLYLKKTNKKEFLKSKKLYLEWYNKIYLKNKKITTKQLSGFIKNLYLVKTNNVIRKNINRDLVNFKKEFKRRNSLYKYYRKNLNLKKIKLMNSAIPSFNWRFCFLVDKHRSKIISKLRNEKMDVSSYYPNVGSRFTKNLFPNSDIIEKKIVNLWLTKEYDKKKIFKQCYLIKSILTNEV